MVATTKFYSRKGIGVRNYSESLRPSDRASRYSRNNRDGDITMAGIEVDKDEVLRVDTVLACVRVLAESMAALPFELHEVDKDGNYTEAKKLPLYELMRWQPNDETTAYELRLWMMIDAIIRGAGYAQVRRDGQNKIIDIWQLMARQMRPMRAPKADGPKRPVGRLIYTYSQCDASGKIQKNSQVLLEADEVLRVQVLPDGGLLSASLIDLQKEAIGASKASEMYSSEFFANGGVVSGVIEVAEEMGEPAYLRLKKDWKESHSNKGERHSVAILEGGAKFNPIALNHEETQLLETRKFQRSTLAGIFRVPAHMINDLEKATFSNVEHIDLAFVKHTLRPWMTNWEQRCRMTLLSLKEKATLCFRHNIGDLIRGDFPTRMDGYSKGVMAGVFSPNDCRRAEGLNSFVGGDQYFVNGTLVKIQDAGKVVPKPANY